MSDDESFVILGTSPMSSMTHESTQCDAGVTSLNALQQSQSEICKFELINQSCHAETVGREDSLSRSIALWKTNEGTPEKPAAGQVTESDKDNYKNNAACEVSNALNMLKLESNNTNSKVSLESVTTDIRNLLKTSKCSNGSSMQKENSNQIINTNSQVSLDTSNSDVIASDSKNDSNTHKPNVVSTTKTNDEAFLGTNKDSLAASFILGEVKADVVKTSVYSQFPSLCSLETRADDVAKLQNFMSEYVELKNTLNKVNATMKLFYEKTQQWKNDMQRMELTYQQQFRECQEQIVSLRNENMALSNDLNTKIDQLTISETIRQKDYDELVKSVSEKTAIIENMRAQIVKLEHQLLLSAGCNSKSTDDFKENPDYVNRLEYERVVKDFERQHSELLAKNLDLQDIQKLYIDEINCLKVNLVGAEEFIRRHQSEINLLKAQKIENSEALQNLNQERSQIREELTLLRQQLDIYSRDFEMERLSRQNLAGEKDQLIQDLRALQNKNKELIEEAQRQYEVTTKQRLQNALSPPSDSVDGEQPAGKQCPICLKTFNNLIILQSHVNDCLDKN